MDIKNELRNDKHLQERVSRIVEKAMDQLHVDKTVLKDCKKRKVPIYLWPG